MIFQLHCNATYYTDCNDLYKESLMLLKKPRNFNTMMHNMDLKRDSLASEKKCDCYKAKGTSNSHKDFTQNMRPMNS